MKTFLCILCNNRAAAKRGNCYISEMYENVWKTILTANLQHLIEMQHKLPSHFQFSDGSENHQRPLGSNNITSDWCKCEASSRPSRWHHVLSDNRKKLGFPLQRAAALITAFIYWIFTLHIYWISAFSFNSWMTSHTHALVSNILLPRQKSGTLLNFSRQKCFFL